MESWEHAIHDCSLCYFDLDDFVILAMGLRMEMGRVGSSEVLYVLI